MIREYVETLYGRYTGLLRLSEALADAELSGAEKDALTAEAAAFGISIVFADVKNEWEEAE